MGLLGLEDTNKALTPALFDEEQVNPVRCYAALRAWMIARLEMVPAFVNAKACRQQLLRNEKRLLKEELGRLSPAGTSTGNSALDRLILSWWPMAFDAE